MVEKALSLSLVAAVALWGVAFVFAPVEAAKRPGVDCAVICFKTEPLVVHEPLPPVIEPPPVEVVIEWPPVE